MAYDTTRIGVYNYLYDILFGVVSDNVYLANPPQTLTESDLKDGFIVIRMASLMDEGQFLGEAYGSVRCYIEAYLPPKTRGRLNDEMFEEYERSIDMALKEAIERGDKTYAIELGDALSAELIETNNMDNIFNVLAKSFIVTIN